MRGNLNEIKIFGRIFDYRLHPMKKTNTVVGEGILEYKRSFSGTMEKFYKFPIRWFGNAAEKLTHVPNGTEISIRGILTEDIRPIIGESDKVRSKVYIDISKCWLCYKNEEILNSRLLGFIKPQGSENARITVLAYKDINGDYVELEDEQVKSIFAPEGKVFAGKFQFEKYSVKENSFVEFSCSPKKEGFEGGDDYIMDYIGQSVKQKNLIPIIHTSSYLSVKEGFVTQDELKQIVQGKDINGSSFYINFDDKILGLFRKDKEGNVIPSDGTEVTLYTISEYRDAVLEYEGQRYFIPSQMEKVLDPVLKIDCMTDKRLGDWFKAKIKQVISAADLLKLKKEKLTDFMSNFNDSDIDRTRLDRIKNRFTNLEFTCEEMKQFLDANSPLMESLQKQVISMESDFKKEWIDKLQNQRAALITEKQNLETQIEDLKTKHTAELNTMDKQIKERKDELQHLDDNREKIVGEIKDLLPFLPQQIAQEPNKKMAILEAISFKAAGKTFSDLENDDGYTFGALLLKNLTWDEIPNSIKTGFNNESDLFSKNAIFIPCVSWAYIYAKAIRNSKLFVLHIEYDWLHYEDYLDNGLKQVIDMCYECENENIVLLLDSINITQPECGLKPLLDAINGYSLRLPIINKALPQNLKILATVLPSSGENKLGLQLAQELFSNWGAVGNPSNTEDYIALPKNIIIDDEAIGYFVPANLCTNSISNSEKKDCYFGY